MGNALRPDNVVGTGIVSVLDYLYPISVALVFLLAKTFSICTLQTPKTGLAINRSRIVVLCLLLAVFGAYIGQTILFISRALFEKGWWAPEHCVIEVLSSLLVWGGLGLSLLSSPSPLWHPYMSAFLIGLAFEIALCALSPFGFETNSTFSTILLLLEVLRIACFFALTIAGAFLVQSRGDEYTALDEERQSLLVPETNDTAAATTPVGKQYGPVESAEEIDDEESDDNQEIKEMQRKRLEEEGGWWGYVKGFAIFLPYMWPSHNRKVQACLALMGLHLVLERFVNLLEPRQIGILTDKLSEEFGKGIFPWKDFLLFVFFWWMNSPAGIEAVKQLARIPVQNYSRERISNLAFKHVMSLSMDFHGSKDSGEVLKALDQAQVLHDLLELILFELSPVLVDLIIGIVYITYLFDSYVAFVLVLVGVAYISTTLRLTNWVQPKRRVFNEKDRFEHKTIYASVSNWQTVAYFNRVPYEQKRYGDSVKAAIDTSAAYYMATTLMWAVEFFIMTLGIATCSFMAVYQITFQGKPVGSFVTLLFYWWVLMRPLDRVASSFKEVSSALIDAERLLQLLQTKPTVQNTVEAKTLVVTKAKVEFDSVDFSYDDRKQTLKNINFTADPGKTIGFVGETGGGKSTLMNLLFRFYDVKGGSIKIDGQDIRSVSVESLREALGAVPQDPSLFNQSILDNVRYARLDATDDEIEEACKAAAVHDKIMTFPDKYKTVVGERGLKLSGGELQRIAIARVILKNPRIVMLDEATSAVDSSTEELIQSAFQKLSAGRTTFVIAHRLSTIMDAHLILVVDQGEIIERGTHEELLLQGGKYFELWTKQTESRRSKGSSVLDINQEENQTTELEG